MRGFWDCYGRNGVVMQNGLEIKVVKKIEDLPQGDWEKVFPAALENYNFFKTLDQSSFEQFSFFYLLAYENNHPVAATSCFLFNFPLDVAVNGKIKFLFSAIKKILPNIFSPRVLICGLPMGAGRIGITRDADRVILALDDCLEKIAGEHKAAMVIFKDFTAGYDQMLKPLLSRGFSKIESFPSTEMEINFKSFDEYLKTLSRVSRDGLKRNFKKVDGKLKIEMEVTNVLNDATAEAAHQLYRQTMNRQEMGLENLPLDFFKNASRNMPNEVKFFLWRSEGKLIAFAFCLVRGDYFIDYYLGFDYALAHQYHLYFVRFRDLLNWCIEHGVKRYEMGVTAYEPKRRLGFKFIRFYFYMKHRNRLLNRFVGLVSHFMKPANFDPVFKQMEANDAAAD